MSQNTFEFEGTMYEAKPGKSPGSCDGCAFRLYRRRAPCATVPCMTTEREDGREVIWVAKES